MGYAALLAALGCDKPPPPPTPTSTPTSTSTSTPTATSSSNPAVSSGGDEAKACAMLGVSYCAHVTVCGEASPTFRVGQRRAECVMIYMTWCRAAMRLPDSGLTPDRADECSTELRALALCNSAFLLDDVAACHFAGKRRDGAECGEGPQCRGGHCGTKDTFWSTPGPDYRAGPPRRGKCRSFDW